MKEQKSVYVDTERNLRFMALSKTIEIDAGNLLADMYNRKKAEGGLFFGVDTAGQYTRLENLQTNQDGLSPERKKYLREKWEHPFDIDYYIAFSREEGQPETRVYHEAKSFAFTLGGAIRERRLKAPKGTLEGDAEDDELYQRTAVVKLQDRGVIQIEAVGDIRQLVKQNKKADIVPGTDEISTHIVGEGYPFKGSRKADWYHFYLPMGKQNEGRIAADAEEKEQIRQTAPDGAKLIIEAPAGLYISLTRVVLNELVKLAIADLHQGFQNHQPLQERRLVIEEYTDVSGGINIRTHVTNIVKAYEKAAKVSNTARLEVRPVVKFIRNGDSTQTEEIEIADNGREYWIPERLQAVYFRGLALKRDIQGYWDDMPSYIILPGDKPPVYGSRLLSSYGFEHCVRDFHVITPEPEAEEDTEE